MHAQPDAAKFATSGSAVRLFGLDILNEYRLDPKVLSFRVNT